MIKDTYMLDILSQELANKYDGLPVKVVDTAYVNANYLYAAIEFPDGSVRACMTIVKNYRRRTRWHTLEVENHVYHPMYYDTCPEKILDLLTETNNTIAQQWREINRKKIEKRKSFPKLTKGKLLVVERRSYKDYYLIKQVYAKTIHAWRIEKDTMLPTGFTGSLPKEYFNLPKKYLMNEEHKIYTDEFLELEVKTAMLSK
jgi:hypothetical protein